MNELHGYANDSVNVLQVGHILLFDQISSRISTLFVPNHLQRVMTSVRLWPNGPPNSSQLEPSSQLRWSWVSFGHPLGLSWLELLEFDQAQIFAQLEPSFPPFRHLSQLKPTLSKLFCYCYVTTRPYSDNCTVSCDLTRLGGIVWPPGHASFDVVTWLELGVTVWPGL